MLAAADKKGAATALRILLVEDHPEVAQAQALLLRAIPIWKRKTGLSSR
ncbi:MAG TPA: hypothetical protein VNH11_16535 [Pirellulales bacterium]|nr:hypothetical protein [Pirellulales bacterium]